MIRVTVSGHENLIRKLNATPGIVAEAFALTAKEIQPALTSIIMEVFEEAASFAGEGFPPIYLSSLLEIVASKQIDTMTGMNDFYLFFNLEELGEYSDLMEGFHYKALLADGSQSDIPYKGEELKNPVLKRYLAWLKLDEGAREDTYEARARYWTSIGKAPQWLLLNYGQTLYAPYISPYPVLETIQARIASVAFASLELNIRLNMQKYWGTAFEPDKKLTRITYGSFKKRPNHQYIKKGNLLAGSRKVTY